MLVQVISEQHVRGMATLQRGQSNVQKVPSSKKISLKSLLVLTQDGRLQLHAGESQLFNVEIKSEPQSLFEMQRGSAKPGEGKS